MAVIVTNFGKKDLENTKYTNMSMLCEASTKYVQYSQ